MTNNIYQVLIVDDEPAQQRILSKMLAEHYPQLRLMAICHNVDDALEFLKEAKPDLVFLDMEMPGKRGFELLKELPEVNFEVIFCTSFNKYAIEAFQFSAVDFLLKPFGEEELAKVVKSFEIKMNGLRNSDEISNLVRNLGLPKEEQRLALPTGNGTYYTTPNEVIRIESTKSYTTFFLLDHSQVVVSRSIQEFDDLLTEAGFFRVHLTSLINLKYVVSFKKADGTIKMKDGSEVEVARRRRDEFLQKMNSDSL